MSRTKAARVCKQCHKPLDLLAHPHRVYCRDCAVNRVREHGRQYYHDHRKLNRLTIRGCIICKNEFVYKKGKTKHSKVCVGCVTRFTARISAMSCIFCEKPIKMSNRFTMFCSKKCSSKSWYLLKTIAKAKKKVTK